jgi:hypothetical protein
MILKLSADFRESYLLSGSALVACTFDNPKENRLMSEKIMNQKRFGKTTLQRHYNLKPAVTVRPVGPSGATNCF